MLEIVNNQKETRKFAKKIFNSLKAGDIIALNGDLGAGKTFFTQSIAELLKIKTTVNSPTFVIMKIYNTDNKKIKKLIHIDAYRLNSEEELDLIGAKEYFNCSDCIVVIEWAEKIQKILPPKTKILNFQILSKNKRKISY